MTTFKMPEPATWGLKDYITRCDKPLFTEDQLKQALRDVLEQAAQKFDRRGSEHTSEEVARSIRAMKEKIK